MKKWFVTLLCCTLFLGAYSQNIVTDSIFIDFLPDSLLPFNLNITDVTDNRTGSPKYISHSKTKKFILIPVDQEISTRLPLEQEVSNSFNKGSIPSEGYGLEIDYFRIERYNGRFFHPYILRADIPVYRVKDTTRNYIGTLSYNKEYVPRVRKTPKSETCQSMLNLWHTELKLDLMSLDGFTKSNTNKPDNFILEKLNRPHFLHLTVGTVVGLKFYQVETELFFTRPETNQNQWFLANIVRYQHTEDFELIGFGRKSEHFNTRFNQNWSFDVNSNFLLGLNKWKETQDKSLYHIINFSLSSTQSISLNKINKSGFKFNVGLFENFYYIITMNPKFQVGIYLSTGYKF